MGKRGKAIPCNNSYIALRTCIAKMQAREDRGNNFNLQRLGAKQAREVRGNNSPKPAGPGKTGETI